MPTSMLFRGHLPQFLRRGAAVGLIALLTGATGALWGSVVISIEDRESGNWEESFPGSVHNSVGLPVDAYDGSGEDYWNGAQKFARLPAAGLNYGQDHGAPVRSPWSITATSSGQQASFALTGQVSRVFTYERFRTNEYGDVISETVDMNTFYDLTLRFEEVLTVNKSAGRTGVAGRITGLTGSVQYTTGASTHTGYEFSNFSPGELLSVAAGGDVAIYHDANHEGSTTGAFDFNLDPAAHDPAWTEVLFNHLQPDNSPLVALGAIYAHLSAGVKAGEDTSSAQLSVQGSFSYTFEEANQAGEFIFTGADVFARDYFNPENWSKRMTPGVVDHVQFTHADSKEVDFGYFGYGGIEDNRTLHVSNGGTTTVDLNAVSYFTSWRLGKSFSDIDELALRIDAGKLIIKGGLLDIVGSATLAAGAGQVSALEVDTGGRIKFANRVSDTHEIAPSVLIVGGNGRGTLTIRNGGALTADVIIAGESAGSTGEIVVSGTGSQLHASGLIVGQLGQGGLTVENGGKATLSNFVVGGGASWQGQVTVRNAGSELMLESGSLVGGEGGGRGRLDVLEGGTLRGSPEAGSSIVLGIGGGNPAQSSTVLVSGSGSTLANLGVAVRAGGLLHVRDGASWTAGGGESNLLIGGGEAIFQNTAAVNLHSIEVNSVYRDGVLTPDRLIASGRLNVLSGAVVNVVDTLAIGAGAQVNVNGTGARIEGMEYGRIVGSLNVSNGGQVLAGQMGRIIVENGGVISGSGGVIAFQPKTDGEGEFIPYVQVQAGGSIRPGNSPGTLTINGDVIFDAGSHLQLEIGGATAGLLYDQLVVTGDALFAEGSMVEFAFTNGFAPTMGQTFSFFDVGGTLNFNTALASFSVIGLEVGWSYETALTEGGFALKSLSNGVATTSAIPEPSTYAALVGVVALGLALWRRRRS